ncbi:hypothetical protein [Aeromonas sp. R1-2]|uniref:hypothetical protein n=1 Tax=Aeromonas sp. R1-2 TaxID=3138456 RepID=UPI0034A4C739
MAECTKIARDHFGAACFLAVLAHPHAHDRRGRVVDCLRAEMYRTEGLAPRQFQTKGLTYSCLSKINDETRQRVLFGACENIQRGLLIVRAHHRMLFGGETLRAVIGHPDWGIRDGTAAEAAGVQNARRDVWRKYRGVAHLYQAAELVGIRMLLESGAEPCLTPQGLVRMLLAQEYKLDWLTPTIESAENRLLLAAKTKGRPIPFMTAGGNFRLDPTAPWLIRLFIDSLETSNLPNSVPPRLPPADIK